MNLCFFHLLVLFYISTIYFCVLYDICNDGVVLSNNMKRRYMNELFYVMLSGPYIIRTRLLLKHSLRSCKKRDFWLTALVTYCRLTIPSKKRNMNSLLEFFICFSAGLQTYLDVHATYTF